MAAAVRGRAVPAPRRPPRPGRGGTGAGGGPAGAVAGRASPRRARPSCRPSPPASSAGRPSSSWLHALLPGRPPSPAGPPQASPVALITGTAGVGKTTLAIRFARQAGPLFPDGQLYVNLRGFDPASAPMPPGTALQWFFDALGVPAHERAVRRSRRRARCCARCSTASGCCCCSTTRTTRTRCGRCCPAAPAAWCS